MRRLKPLGLFAFVCASVLPIALGCSTKTSEPPTGPPPGTVTGDGSVTGTGFVTAAASPTTVSTFGISSITAVVQDEQGNPATDGTQVTFALSNSTLGTLSATSAATIGGTARVTFTAGNHTGAVTVSATANGVASTTTVTITPSATAAISLTAAPSSVLTGAASQITARVVDASGNPVTDGTAVSFSLDNPALGTISPPQATTTNGSVVVSFTAGQTTGNVSLQASSSTTMGAIPLTITSTMTTTGGTVTVSANPSSIPTFGATTLTAVVVDGTGNPVADNTAVAFTLTGAAATVSAPTANTRGGIASVVLTAQAAAGTINVTATAGTVRGQLAVTVNAPNAAAISLTASPSYLSIAGMSTVTARVLDSSGNPAVDGTVVTFSLDDPALGVLSLSQAVTSGGAATIRFNAGNRTGTATITATSGMVSGTIAVQISLATVGSVSVAANPSAITVFGTSAITVTVTDNAGMPAPNGTPVSFMLNDNTNGTLSQVSGTTFNGTTTVTFTAGATPRAIVATATAGAISSTVTITINPTTAASLEFVSATPQAIGIKRSGQTETSVIRFLVKDVNGNPVTDGNTVNFTVRGPGGGEYLFPTSGSTIMGFAQTTLQSGAVAGPVTVTASVTVSGTTISTSSAVISIGGGIPSATHFSLAAEQLAIPGIHRVNITDAISGYVADRFGNYNVLTGTSISFYTEAGAIDRSAITAADGSVSVNLRTQAPAPANVAMEAWELQRITAINAATFANLPIDGSRHMRDGWVSILGTVQGEESFSDANGNGVYDSGEAFADLPEPFLDKNDDRCYNNGTTKNCNGVVTASSDPFEEFIDTNGNAMFDAPNGRWDGPGCTATGCLSSRTIWTTLTIAFTGPPVTCRVFDVTTGGAGNFAIPDGGRHTFASVLGDINLNFLPAGTMYTNEASAGTQSGDTGQALPNTLPGQPWVSFFSVSDTTAGDTEAPDPLAIDFTVEETTDTPGCSDSINGQVD